MKKTYFSLENPIILEKSTRIKKAKQIARILRIHLKGQDLKKMKVLDIGCSSGVITSCLAEYFGNIIGIDIDKNAIDMAKKENSKKNVKFYVMDAKNLNFSENSFDLIMYNQIYVYDENPQSQISQIYRVLRPGGICFFSGVNKYALSKPKDAWPTYYRSCWELKKLLHDFRIYYYSKNVASMRMSFVKFIPNFVWKIFEPLVPNFIWILEKPFD